MADPTHRIEPTMEEMRTALTTIMRRVALTPVEFATLGLCVKRIDDWHRMNNDAIAADQFRDAIRTFIGIP